MTRRHNRHAPARVAMRTTGMHATRILMDELWLYFYTGCMLGRASRTKETLSYFCENMDPDKWDMIVWHRVTRNPQEFHGLTGCQRDPRILSVIA